MAKIKPRDIPKKERDKILEEFLDIIIKLKSKKEAIDFFVGMMTPSEALMFSRRIQIAKLILKKESYGSIIEELGVGKGTISQVDKWLFARDNAYRKVLERYLKNSNPIYKKGSRLDRYPGHKLAKMLSGLDYFDN